eukprot:scaffold56458_cov17-Prasinocladus_malaysianus.AAC.1
MECFVSTVTDVEPCMSKMEELLMDHNATSKKPMNLAVFLYAVEHISRICRVIKQPGGHMLNVGLGGSGRQSLTRLSAFICGMEHEYSRARHTIISMTEVAKLISSQNEWLKRRCRKTEVVRFCSTPAEPEDF